MSENLKAIKERDAYFDNAKGFLMITVVVGHLVTSLVNTFEEFAFLSNYIYLFHMPAFAFISGYLMKGRVRRRDYASVINKTLVPYLVAQILIYLCGVILPDGVKALSVERLYESGVFSFFFPIYHLWYFWGIIIAFVFCVAVNATKHPVRAFILSVVISLLAGFMPIVDFMRLSKVLGLLPFFVLGNIFTKTQIEFLKNKKALVVPGVIVIILSAFCIWELRFEGSLKGIFAMNSWYGDYVFDLSPLEALATRGGFLAVATLFVFSFMTLCPGTKTPFEFLGRNSIYIYILHVIPIAVIRHFHYETRFLYELDTPLLKIMFVAFGVVLTFVLATKPVVKLFKPLFDPAFDIRSIGKNSKTE